MKRPAPRIHPHYTARNLALEVLIQVEQQQAYSHLQLNNCLQEAKFNQVDRAFATELVYGTIQRRYTIDRVLEQKVRLGLVKVKLWVRNLLRMTAYQLHYLDRIPVHAAIYEAVHIAKRRGGQAVGGFINGVLRALVRQPELWNVPKELDFISRLAWQYSHPPWLISRWIMTYGEIDTIAMCEANNHRAHSSARVNQLRITRTKLLADMQVKGIKAEPSLLSQDGIVVKETGNLAHSIWYTNGQLSIQDESSMLVMEALRPEAGMRILDCCAAPGGKTFHIAERMGDQGVVMANDLHAHKMELMTAQAKRLGICSVTTMNIDATTLGSLFPHNSFDAVLLDAPCTGFGVIRRKPDIKWNKKPDDIMTMAKLQLQLILQATQLVRVGGRLVYSTCTVEPTENEQLIQQFLTTSTCHCWELDDTWKHHLPVKLQSAIQRSTVGMLQVLPHDGNSDGFFIACLRKKQLE